MTNYAALAHIGLERGQGIAVSLYDLQTAIVANNYEKGWRTTLPKDESGNLVGQRNVGELIALLHSEVSEAYESHRNNEPVLWYRTKTTGPGDHNSAGPLEHDGTPAKPEGIASELADVIIRVLDMADKHEIPVVRAILEKHAYNQTRPYRHGGKKA